MSAHTGDMICGLREHIRFLSDVMTLKPGVLITTGTPAGVSKLADGDHLRGSIQRIGEMEVAGLGERQRGAEPRRRKKVDRRGTTPNTRQLKTTARGAPAV